VGLLSLLRKLSSAFKKSAQETGAQIESAFADLHLDVSFWREADVPARSNDICSWGKTGRHVLVESLPVLTPSGLREHSRDLPIAALFTDRAMEAWYDLSIA